MTLGSFDRIISNKKGGEYILKDRIKKIRKELDLTQQEFADRIGVKRGGIANYEIRQEMNKLLRLSAQYSPVKMILLKKDLFQCFLH